MICYCDFLGHILWVFRLYIEKLHVIGWFMFFDCDIPWSYTLGIWAVY